MTAYYLKSQVIVKLFIYMFNLYNKTFTKSHANTILERIILCLMLI